MASACTPSDTKPIKVRVPGTRCPGCGGAEERFRGAVRAVHSLAGAVWEAPGIPGRGGGRTTLQRISWDLPARKSARGCREIRDAERTPASGSDQVSAATPGLQSCGGWAFPTPAVTNSAPNSDRICYENFSYPPLSDVLVLPRIKVINFTFPHIGKVLKNLIKVDLICGPLKLGIFPVPNTVCI